MVRHLSRLLVLALVPVLIVTAPNVAQAAPVYSEAETATITSTAESTPGSQTSCTVVTYWAQDESGTTPSLPASTSCSTGFNISDSLVSFDLHGGSCNFHMNIGQVDGQPNPHKWAFTTTGGYDGSTCNVTELCMNYVEESHSNPFTTITGTDCVPIGLGAPPVSQDLSGTCQSAIFGRPELGAPKTGQDGVVKGWHVNVTTAGQAGPLGTDPGYSFIYYALIKRNGHGDLASGNFTPGSGGSSAMTATAPAIGETLRYHYHSVSWSDVVAGPFSRHVGVAGWWSGGPSEMPHGEVIGVGIIGQRSSISNAMRYPSAGAMEGRLGATIPGDCTFYWGERVVTLENTDMDDPLAPLTGGGGTGSAEPPDVTDPPPPSTGSCDFSFSDPTTWAGGGICALVELISSLLNLIGDVLDFLWGLVEALGNMIRDLFVPSEGFMEDQAQGLQDAWGDTPPAVFIDSAQDVGESVIVSSPGGGCTGPAWTFNKPGPLGGGTATVHPFEACEAPMSTLATIVRTGLTVGVYLGAFLVALRIVAAAFGVQLNVGRGQEDTA